MEVIVHQPKEARVLDREQRSDRFTAIEDLYAGYEVYDPNDEKIGKVDDLFVDENDQPEYLGVKTGLFGLRSTLIPWEMVRVDEGQRVIEISADKDHVKDAPNFDDDKDITPEFEREVYSHFGLQHTESDGEHGRYGAYYGAATDEASGERHPGIAMGDVDRQRGQFREHDPAAEGLAEPEDDLRDEDELRVQRTEEELRAGVREREAGAMNVRKRVRTDREQLRVPKRREEVHIDRVPVEGREVARDIVEKAYNRRQQVTGGDSSAGQQQQQQRSAFGDGEGDRPEAHRLRRGEER